MATEAEIKLGRLVVTRGLATDAQVLAALRERNADPDGPDLGQRLVAMGLFSGYVCEELKRVATGSPEERRPRHEQSTDAMISLGTAREAISRECLNEAIAMLGPSRKAALEEIARLAEEFSDTESGLKAKSVLEAERGKGQGGA